MEDQTPHGLHGINSLHRVCVLCKLFNEGCMYTALILFVRQLIF